MTDTSIRGAPGAEDGAGATRAGLDADRAGQARYEREVAALDLSDAEQAGCWSAPRTDLATELYDSADRHRRLAERLEAGDASAVPDVEAIRPASPDE